MQLVTNPSAPAPAPSDVVRRAPSTLQVPVLEDGSAAASASLGQVANYVGMLHAALGEDPGFYAQLVKRGFLDSAIDYARYTIEVLDTDGHVDNDGFEGLVEGAVLEALLAVRGMGTPAVAEPNLADELEMAGSAARTAAESLLALATRPTP